jgi:multiple sugar transport system substrate-binding protein
MSEKSLAMLPFFGTGIIGELEQLTKDGKVPFQWDIVSYPSFQDNPGKSAASNFHLMLLSATSAHKEQAFDVMALAASKEVQLDESKNGRVSVLKGQEYEKTFGSNLASLKGKNVPSIFMTVPTLNPSPTLYDTKVTGPIDRAFKSVVSENKDINTALREAQEAAEKAIQEAKAQ